jgi:hypothetical protein
VPFTRNPPDPADDTEVDVMRPVITTPDAKIKKKEKNNSQPLPHNSRLAIIIC